eukprot:snap_masked-scaffold_1-processed-gene-20.39-mRNA-1 protein AED:1.00 eAED:1.00 QI:0/0/0/0/1/1/4/0/536
MQFDTIEELDEVIARYRKKLSETINESSKESDKSKKEFGRSSSSAKDTIYAVDPIVERLYNMSPPEDTYLLNSSDSELDDPNEYNGFYPPYQPNSTKNMEKKFPTFQLNSNTPDHTDELPPLVFEKKEIIPIQDPKESKISSLLKQEEKNLLEPLSGEIIHLKFYLPKESGLKKVSTDVGADFTVRESIERLLLTLLANKNYTWKFKLGESFYELRTHWENGLPFDDLPALDEQNLIKEYADETEFCLVEKRVDGETNPKLEKFAEKMSVSDLSEEKKYVSKLSKSVGKVQGGCALKISLPLNAGHTILPVQEGTTGYDLLEKIVRSHRVSIHGPRYEFHLLDEDKKSLSRIRTEIRLDADFYNDLYLKGVRSVLLKEKIFADDPRSSFMQKCKKAQTRFKEESLKKKMKEKRKEEKLDPKNVIFSETTAYQYQSWKVIKTNKWGKRQRRVLGIDRQKLYNKIREDDDQTSKKVKKAERLIVNIVDVDFHPDGNNYIQIFYKKKTGRIGVLQYEIEDGPKAAAHIISKITYIIDHL